MSLGRGFQAVLDWKKEVDEQKAARGDFVPMLSLGDGETIEGLWLLDTNDPLMVQLHTFRENANKFKTIIHNHEEPSECLGCYLQMSGDKRMSFVNTKPTFTVADPRWFHMYRDGDKFMKERCLNNDDGEGNCKLCASGKVARSRGGVKRWETNAGIVNALMVLNSDDLAKMCTCGGVLKKGECSKCSNFQPLDIFKVPLKVTRTGKDKKTTYQVRFSLPEPMPEWLESVELPDLEKIYKIQSSDAQANILGIPNPLGGKKRVVSYDEKKEDEEETLFG